MTWEQKLAAIMALRDTNIKMRVPGDWYVSQSGIEIKETHNDALLRGISGNGNTPEAAVLDHWRKLTELKPTGYIVIDAYGDRRQHVRWNGYMWQDVGHLYPTTETKR